MSYLKRIHLNGICFAVLFLLPGLLQAQNFECVVDYRHIGLHDTIKLTISYDGNPDYVGSIHPDLRPFTIIAGPAQSSSTLNKMVNGQAKVTYGLKVVYYLRADTLGKYIIPGATLVTDDGDTLHTAPVAMEVSPQPFRKTDRTFSISWEDNEEVFEDMAYHEFDAPRAIGNKINMSGAPFVLITGWIYQPPSLSAGSALKILTAVDSFLQSRPDALLMDHKVTRSLPRLYYTLSDTTGITAPLFELYKAGGKEAHAGIIIVDPRHWTNREEWEGFIEPHNFRTVIYTLLANAAGRNFDPLQKRPVEIRCFLRDLQQANSFIDRMKQLGYKAGDNNLKEKAEGKGYYVDIIKPMPMIAGELYATVMTVADEINKPEYKGRVSRLGIGDPPKKK